MLCNVLESVYFVIVYILVRNYKLVYVRCVSLMQAEILPDSKKHSIRFTLHQGLSHVWKI